MSKAEELISSLLEDSKILLYKLMSVADKFGGDAVEDTADSIRVSFRDSDAASDFGLHVLNKYRRAKIDIRGNTVFVWA